MNKTAIFIIGLPGCGKSTLSLLLKNDNNEIVSSSTLLKSLSKEQSDLLKKEYINKGIDIPDDLYVQLIVNYILQSAKEIFLIEGFPYNSNQITLAESSFKKNHISISKVLYLNVSKEKAIEKTKNRRVCSHCFKSFSNSERFCDVCGTKTILRIDDSPLIARKRINNLALFLDEVVAYYKNKNILIEFDLSERDILSFMQNQRNKIC